jgi:phosphoglycerate dehydrogenase-like enzyme
MVSTAEGAGPVNVLLHYLASPGFRAALEKVCPKDVTLTIVDAADDAAFHKALPTTEAILHVLRPLSASDIARAPKLKLIQKIGVGVNTIDLDAARGAGVAVCNMPGTNSQAVAELALMLMLAALRRASYFDGLIRRGEGWRPDAAALDNVGEIAGRTVGLVGFGAIPQLLTPALRALGANVIYTARSQRSAADADFVTLDELLSQADIVSLHCPATPETIGMISRTAIARMKPCAVLVNTARGELVDEAALVDALRSGHLRAAGLDVFGREPTAADNPLFALPNVVLTPHVGWLTPETLARSMTVAFENCRRVAAGEALLHRVV